MFKLEELKDFKRLPVDFKEGKWFCEIPPLRPSGTSPEGEDLAGTKVISDFRYTELLYFQ
jgi:hypothetical protein